MKKLFYSLLLFLAANAQAFEIHKHSLKVLGHKRRYVVTTPDGYDPKQKYTTVFYLHGARILIDPFPVMYMDRFTDPAQIIAVRPLARWHKGLIRWGNGRDKEEFHDVEFIAAVKSEVAKNYATDDKKTFLMGESSGGMMAARIAKEMPKLFEAYAIISGSLEYKNQEPGLTPIHLIQVHGSNDSLVKYQEGKGTLATIGARQSFALWAAADQLDLPQVQVSEETFTSVEKKTYSITIETYNSVQSSKNYFSSFVTLHDYGHMLMLDLKDYVFPQIMQFFDHVYSVESRL